MSATDFRKMVMTNGGNRFIGVECSDGTRTTLMIDGMQGYSPQLDLEEVNGLIDALVGAAQVMRDART